jgi:electron transfer flavoprotein alpha subunit
VGAIWAVLQHRDGKLHRGSWEAIAAAQQLAKLQGCRAEAAILGAGVGALAAEVGGRASLSAVHVLDAPSLAAYTPGAYVGALAAVLRGAAPDFVVFAHTYQTVDFMARLAVEIEAALIPEVLSFDNSGGSLEFKRPVLGGKMHAKVRLRGQGCALLSVQSGAFPVDSLEGGNSPVEAWPGSLAAAVADRQILRVEEAAGDAIDLTKAEVIVAAGRGVGGADKMAPIHELAAALGAEIGASRPVIDNGWLPRDRQIGSSGQTVAPRLYVAVGISGAIQHLVGMKGSTVVVAINKDPGAPIFSVAHYGIVGDLHEILPALSAAIRSVKES